MRNTIAMAPVDLAGGPAGAVVLKLPEMLAELTN